MDVSFQVFDIKAIIHITTEVRYTVKGLGKDWINLRRGNRIDNCEWTGRLMMGGSNVDPDDKSR